MLDYQKYPSDLPFGVQWINVKGAVTKIKSGSRLNQIEVDAVCKIFQETWEKISNTNLTIGIVTPYNGQRHAISEKIKLLVPATTLGARVRVLTAHQFQGSEADIIIFSFVISAQGNGGNDKWYNIYPQILNVALSRARYLLYIVGDEDFCKNRVGILGKIEDAYCKIKDAETLEECGLYARFDTPTERLFYEELQKIGLEKMGYKLMPKLVAKRYTLDFAIVGKKRIDIEIDGTQHEIIGGIPVCEDIERDKFLREKEGWQILRFPNHRFLSEMPKIIEELLLVLK